MKIVTSKQNLQNKLTYVCIFSSKFLTLLSCIKNDGICLFRAVVQTLTENQTVELLIRLYDAPLSPPHPSQPQGGGRVQLHPARDALQTLPVRVSWLRGDGSQGAAGAAQTRAAHSGDSVQTMATACCVGGSEDSHHCWFVGQMLQVQHQSRALLPERPWGKTQLEKYCLSRNWFFLFAKQITLSLTFYKRSG